MKEENRYYGLSQNKRYMLGVINRLTIGSILILWGSLLMLKQVGIIKKDLSTWPFAFIAFGILLVVCGIYRLYAREKSARAEPHSKN